MAYNCATLPPPGHADSQVDFGEAVTSQDQNWLQSFVTKTGGLQELNGLTIDSDESFTSLTVCNCDRVLLAAKNLNGLYLFAHGEFLPQTINVNKQKVRRRSRDSIAHKTITPTIKNHPVLRLRHNGVAGEYEIRGTECCVHAFEQQHHVLSQSYHNQ